MSRQQLDEAAPTRDRIGHTFPGRAPADTLDSMDIHDPNRPLLIAPNADQADKRVLLHSCCAPCAADVMSEMKRSGIDFTILFYNPNIHPQNEYLIRKNENKRYADTLGVPFVDLDYDTDNWFA